jgi:hypothetical protein
MTYFPLLNANQTTTSSANESTQNQSQQQRTQNIRANAGINNRFYDAARAEEIIRVNGGYEITISPLYKRFLAEVLDTFLLFLIKIIVFVVIIDLFDVSLDFDILTDISDMKFLEDNYTEMWDLSSGFLLLEISTKLISCLYEAFFSVKFGASIGKMVLGIKILHAEAVVPLEQQANHTQGIRALVYPASSLTFVSFIRDCLIC